MDLEIERRQFKAAAAIADRTIYRLTGGDTKILIRRIETPFEI